MKRKPTLRERPASPWLVTIVCAALFVAVAPDGQVDATSFVMPRELNVAARGAAGPAVLDARTTDGLVRLLGAAPPGSPVWMSVAETSDLPTGRRVQQLREIFTRAGWRVEPLHRSGRTRPGYHLFVGDEGPLPPSVGVLIQAFQGVGLPLTIAQGYRAHYGRMLQSVAGFDGFPLGPTQTFVLTVSRADP